MGLNDTLETVSDAELETAAWHDLEVKHLHHLCNPLAAWPELEKPILIGEVRDCLAAGRAENVETPSWLSLGRRAISMETARENHIRKIAFFVQQGFSQPISLDVGIPEMAGGHVSHLVEDGNHRLAAAIIRKDSTIRAKVGGSVRHAQSLGLWNPNPQEQEIWRRFEKKQARKSAPKP